MVTCGDKGRLDLVFFSQKRAISSLAVVPIGTTLRKEQRRAVRTHGRRFGPGSTGRSDGALHNPHHRQPAPRSHGNCTLRQIKSS